MANDIITSRTGRVEVWSVSPAGGESVHVTAGGGSSGFESERGVLYYWRRDPGKKTALMRREAVGDREVPLDLPGRYGCVVSRAVGGFYYQAGGAGGIYLYEEATGRSIRVLKNPGKYFAAFTMSPDGMWLATDFPSSLTRDLMIMEHFR